MLVAVWAKLWQKEANIEILILFLPNPLECIRVKGQHYSGLIDNI